MLFRSGIVDENGNIYINNDLLTVMTKLFLDSEIKRGRVVKKIGVPISARSEIEDLARYYNVELVYTKSTHADMMAAATQEDIAFVGGTLGGAIFPDYFFAVDGMFTVAKTLEMLAVLGKDLGEVASDMPRNAQVRRDVNCPTEELGRVMRQAMDHSRDMRKILIDGIKFYPRADSDSWVLIIPEKDRPYCTVLADARDEKEATALADEYASYVEAWRKAGG